jgi:alkylhydroperoxidase family enzyme
LQEWESSDLFSDRERLALTYADAITLSDQDVNDELFAQIQKEFDEEEIVELTATIAWESSSSKFNRALRVPAQGLWERVRRRR